MRIPKPYTFHKSTGIPKFDILKDEMMRYKMRTEVQDSRFDHSGSDLLSGNRSCTFTWWKSFACSTEIV